MAWESLPTDYTDAVWSGLKKYSQVDNSDGTVSFQDVTIYTNREKSFFGAKDANRMNAALNTVMEAVENGADLTVAGRLIFDGGLAVASFGTEAPETAVKNPVPGQVYFQII